MPATACLPLLHAVCPGICCTGDGVAGWVSKADGLHPVLCRWIDPLAVITYEHWGNWTDEEGLPEPNNLYGGEYCGGANATERHSGAYGWADVTCSRPGAFMCKIICG